MCGCPSHVPNWGPGPQPMCPDWELNQQPFGLQASTQSAEPHQTGPKGIFLKGIDGNSFIQNTNNNNNNNNNNRVETLYLRRMNKLIMFNWKLLPQTRTSEGQGQCLVYLSAHIAICNRYLLS